MIFRVPTGDFARFKGLLAELLFPGNAGDGGNFSELLLKAVSPHPESRNVWGHEVKRIGHGVTRKGEGPKIEASTRKVFLSEPLDPEDRVESTALPATVGL